MFSTKGRYALRVMIDLAQQDSEAYIPLKDIAERQDQKYMDRHIAIPLCLELVEKAVDIVLPESLRNILLVKL